MRDGSLEKCIGRYGKNMHVLYIYIALLLRPLCFSVPAGSFRWCCSQQEREEF